MKKAPPICERVEGWIFRERDGEGLSGQEVQALAEHLPVCQDCRLLDERSRILQGFWAVPVLPSAGEAAKARLLAQIRDPAIALPPVRPENRRPSAPAKRPPEPDSSKAPIGRWSWTSLFARASLIVLGLALTAVFIFLRMTPSNPRPPAAFHVSFRDEWELAAALNQGALRVVRYPSGPGQAAGFEELADGLTGAILYFPEGSTGRREACQALVLVKGRSGPGCPRSAS